MQHVTVRVTPKATRNEITEKDGTLHVRLAAPATDGRANAALMAALAGHYGVPKANIRILRGHRSRDKIVAIW